MAEDKGYQERFYRKGTDANGLVSQEVIVAETDLFISSDKDIKDIARRIVEKYRRQIEGYMKSHPRFKDSLKPLEMDSSAPDIVKDMLRSSSLAGVGPMASVAGAMAEFVGKELLSHSRQIIVENGGDIFIKTDKERTAAVFAGKSPLSNKLCIKIKPEGTPLGICTSSGTVGHSLSFGKGDACVIISTSASLADAVATSACNKVKDKEDIQPALEFAIGIEGVRGALIVLGMEFGAVGDVELERGKKGTVLF